MSRASGVATLATCFSGVMRAIIIHPDAVEERHRRPTGAEPGQVSFQMLECACPFFPLRVVVSPPAFDIRRLRQH